MHKTAKAGTALVEAGEGYSGLLWSPWDVSGTDNWQNVT